MIWGKPKPVVPRTVWSADERVLSFSERKADEWTIRDSFTGTLVLGQAGSGKTSGPGKTLARRFLELGYGGLVLCSKSEEADDWRALLKTTKRDGDGVFFGIGEPHRFNFLDYEGSRSGGGLGMVENLVNLITDITGVGKTSLEGNDATFFVPMKRMVVRNAFSLLLLAEKPLALSLIPDLLQSSPKDPDQAEKDAKWQKESFLYQTILEAERLNPGHPELEAVARYWLHFRPRVNLERGTIDAGLLGWIDGPLSRGDIADLFSTATNLTPEDCFKGKVIVVNLPIDQLREAGQYAAMIWNTAFYRASMRRPRWTPKMRPVFLWCDEAQNFSTEQDAEFHSECRARGVACVRMTQNRALFLKAYGGSHKAEHTVDAIFGNLATKLFCRNDCPITNAWASKIVAKEVNYRSSYSKSERDAVGSTTLSEAYEDACPPETFLGLRNGGKSNRRIVEAVLFASGRKFKGSERWLVRRFQQENA
jgi:hypothetical protein